MAKKIITNTKKHISTRLSEANVKSVDIINKLKEEYVIYDRVKPTSLAKASGNEIRRLPFKAINESIITPALLSNAANKPESHLTAFEKMDIVRDGVSKKDLENLKEITELGYDDLAKALMVTRATLINKKGEEKFNAPLSERIVGLADIYSYGYEVFEDEERFNQWMFRPNQALGGHPPYDLVDNQFGREEVKNIIGRIDYGVYS